MKPSYEPGMKINYDPVSKRVVVAFRGRIVVLPDSYESEPAGIAAGETYCHRQGWKPRDKKDKKHKFRSL